MRTKNFKSVMPRNVVQIIFAFFVLYIGITFVLFIEQIVNNVEPIVSRPPGVEGFLPISALIGFKAWVATGRFDPIHPAGLVIFLGAIIMSLLLKRTFCSWICPIGTLSEGLAKIGKKLIGRNFLIPKWLDYGLRSIKYILLSIFITTVLFAMSGNDALNFLYTPYNMLADVKMLRFFQSLGLIGMTVIVLLVLLSVLFENFWCRYLCPYGALLGLFSIVSPFKITRNRESCLKCGKCTISCPNRIPVEKADKVWSPECSGCLKCVKECPANDTLMFKTGMGRQGLVPRNIALGVLGLWLFIIGIAIETGHWESKVSVEVYKSLLPVVDQISH